MNEIILLVVPIVIIIMSVCQKTKTYKTLEKLFYYSKYIALFIPFFLIYLKPDLKNKIMGYFQEIDQKPLHQNINDLMMGYMDTKKNANQVRRNYGSFQVPGNQNFNIPLPQNNRMNMINPKNMRSGGTRQKRNVSESKKKYIASQQRWTCTHCNQMLDNTYEVDHIIPLYKGGTNDLHNLEALCRNCHGKKTFKDKLGI